MDMLAVAMGAFRQIRTAGTNFTAVIAIPDGNLMSPPKLTGNAPVLNIFQPMVVNFRKPSGNELRIAPIDGCQGFFSQGFHLYEPLFCRQRFYCRLTT